MCGSAIGFMIAAVVLLACAEDRPDDRFLARTYEDASGTVVPYRLFIPHEGDRGERYPLVLFLHGGAGAGDDNLSQISGGNRRGSHVWTEPGNQERYPAFVVAPQLPGMSRWDYPGSDEMSTYGEAAAGLVERLVDEYAIDTDRIYVTGQSRGGWGVWDLIAKRPDLFAAAIPVCGGGDPTRVAAARTVAVWAFHGARDRTVPVERTRELVEVLRAAGATVRYTEYQYSGHTIWDKAYKDDELVDWLYAQRKTSEKGEK